MKKLYFFSLFLPLIIWAKTHKIFIVKEESRNYNAGFFVF
ncbi:hypothetical protein HMPREF0083_04845 [Aneurinibacillus aneurinilyticus ATCC 12856]|uniref:Uncharacterized protein n=1 Tax=Aneurinibacillus aneurinilyticus ATCC 12856 TaxID=649747 RepID=U1WWK0_ANEAE|nr:hypothetical protein HMPREF0083_04845 [Aneurinibacillus aneurinilyticus ATCC 12856]